MDMQLSKGLLRRPLEGKRLDLIFILRENDVFSGSYENMGLGSTRRLSGPAGLSTALFRFYRWNI